MALSVKLRMKLNMAENKAKNIDDLYSVAVALRYYNEVYTNSSSSDFETAETYYKIKNVQNSLFVKLNGLRIKKRVEADELAKKKDDYLSLEKAGKIYHQLRLTKFYFDNYELRQDVSHIDLDKSRECYSLSKEALQRISKGNSNTTNDTATQTKNNSNKKEDSFDLWLKIGIAIFGIIIFFMMMVNDSKPKWSDLSEQEKANAEWAYEVQQYQKEYEKNNKKK